MDLAAHITSFLHIYRPLILPIIIWSSSTECKFTFRGEVYLLFVSQNSKTFIVIQILQAFSKYDFQNMMYKSTFYAVLQHLRFQLTSCRAVPLGELNLLFVMLPCGSITPLPSNRHHRRCGDCLEGKGENYQVCSVQYCVQQLCTVRCTHI